jgi:hypothetical protein
VCISTHNPPPVDVDLCLSDHTTTVNTLQPYRLRRRPRRFSQIDSDYVKILPLDEGGVVRVYHESLLRGDSPVFPAVRSACCVAERMIIADVSTSATALEGGRSPQDARADSIAKRKQREQKWRQVGHGRISM